MFDKRYVIRVYRRHSTVYYKGGLCRPHLMGSWTELIDHAKQYRFKWTAQMAIMYYWFQMYQPISNRKAYTVISIDDLLIMAILES